MFTGRNLWLTRRLSHVPRWAVMPTIRQQSVAEHSFHVAILAGWLLSMHKEGDGEEFRLGVLQSALLHDEDEAATGDHPSPSKTRNMVGLRQDYVVLKCADCLEAILFLYEEQALGNQYGTEAVIDDVKQRFHDYWQLFNFGIGVNARKPITSDIIREAKENIMPKAIPHPVMDLHYARS